MNSREIEEQAQFLIPVLNDLFKTAFSAQKKALDEEYGNRLGELQSQINSANEKIKAFESIEIPTPKDGIDGEKGEKGDQGEAGPQGEKGEAGESVDLDVVRSMIEDAVAKAVEEIPKPKDGADGKDGVDGKDGKDADLDEVKLIISEESKNTLNELIKSIPMPKDGKDGVDGKDGKDGAPGKDGLEIDILPSIHERKSYPRGTWAINNGGLWRSHSVTEGMRGWECIIDCEKFEFAQDPDDPRVVRVIVTNSAGNTKEKAFNFPSVIDRGVYRDEKDYTSGDGVTWAGSYWIAQKDNPEGKPGNEPDNWRLAVKRGRDAQRPTK